MSIEQRIRDAVERRVAGAQASEEAWNSIAKRLDRRQPHIGYRLLVAASALLVAGVLFVGLWMAFRPVEGPRPAGAGSSSPSTQSPSPSTQETSPAVLACRQSEAKGDFDGDGLVDVAILSVLLPSETDCTFGQVAPTFELEIEPGSGGRITQSFPDCQGYEECQLVGASDFGGDGVSELIVNVGPGASVSYDEVFQLSEGSVSPVELAPPGDPDAPFSLEPGPLRLGGPHDAISQSGFECRVTVDDSRELIAWQAERDDGTSPWRIHLTTLKLVDRQFVVVSTDDQTSPANLPPLRGLCPSTA